MIYAIIGEILRNNVACKISALCNSITSNLSASFEQLWTKEMVRWTL